MGQIFDDEQRRRLQIRADLDRIEANSEVTRRDDPTAFTIKFGEHARRGIEALADYLSLPAAQLIADHERREESRMDKLRKVFDATNPNELGSLRLGAWCNTMGETAETLQSVFWLTPTGEVINLFHVAPAGHWEDRIAELTSRPDTPDFEIRMASLRERASSLVHTDFVVSSTQELSAASLEQAASDWLRQYFPRFAEIPIVWETGQSLEAMHAARLRQSLAREIVSNPSMLDELREALEEIDSDEIVE